MNLSINIKWLDRRSRPAFTLIELMIALTVTALLAVGVSSMLFAVTQGTRRNSDQRRINAKRMIVAERTGDVIRAAAQILDASSTSLLVWYGDRNEDGQVNLSEMACLQWSSADQAIVYRTGAAGLAEADDTGYATDSDFTAITASLVGDSRFPQQTWVTRVTACAFTLDAAVAIARRVSLKMTITDADHAVVGDVLGTYSLRGSTP